MNSNNLLKTTLIKIFIIIFTISNVSAQSIQCQPGVQDKFPKRIAWFATSKRPGFWPIVEKFIHKSAKDLDVTIEVYYNMDPIDYINKVQEVLNRKDKPIDGVLFHNYKHLGEKLLKIAEDKGIPTLMFNAGFAKSDNIGNPREKYKCWIGTMLPNDEKAGYQLARILLLEAKKHPNMIYDNKIHMVALEGNRASNASTLRMQGMNRALKEWKQNDNNPEVVFHQSFHSKWRRDLASIAFKLTQSRYPKVSVFWTAADVMALGILDAAKEVKKIPGKDFLTGGVDLLPNTLNHIEKGNITASVGAHYIEGAFALIALYDYLNGYDFSKVGPTQFLTDMAMKVGKQERNLLITNDTVQKQLETIDFTLLSNSHNKRTLPYKLDTQVILDKLWE
jgi:ABC-type sugar transport system substrate-binding protein